MLTLHRQTFLLVEDHPLTRSGTRAMLEHAFPGCSCTEASSVAQARELLRERDWSLVLLDLVLPDGSGIELLPCGAFPAVVLSMSEDPAARASALRAGARLVLSKADSPEGIVAAIRTVLRGAGNGGGASPRAIHLSPREGLVLERLLDGGTLAELAQELGVAPTTLQSYKNRLFAKLDVESIPQLVRMAESLRFLIDSGNDPGGGRIRKV